MIRRPDAIEAGDPLWEQHWAGDRAARAKLIEHHTFIIDAVAKTLIRTVPHHVSLQELWSYGSPGLIRAVDTYDPAKGAFRTHAIVCVRSKILDEIRSQDWAPKSLRRKEKDIRTVERYLTSTLNRTPTAQEVADELGVSVEYVRTTLTAARHSTHRSLDEPMSSDPDFSLVDVAESTLRPVDEMAVMAACQHHVRRWLESQDTLTKTIWALYYYEEKTLTAVAVELGIPNAQVTEVHTQFIVDFLDVLKGLLTEESALAEG
jgi:RNA polymerase sigma factor for flagellar operon FliA